MEKQYAATRQRRVIEWDDVYDTVSDSYSGRRSESNIHEKRVRLRNDVSNKKRRYIRYQSPEIGSENPCRMQ